MFKKLANLAEIAIFGAITLLLTFMAGAFMVAAFNPQVADWLLK